MKRMFTKEAFQDNNFGDGMFKGTADKDDELIDKSDLSKGNRKFEKKQLNLFQRNIMLEFRKQIRVNKIKIIILWKCILYKNIFYYNI